MEALALQKRCLVALLMMLVVACVMQVNDYGRGGDKPAVVQGQLGKRMGACNNEGLASVPCLNEGAPPPAPDKNVMSLQ
jgi:hypothetical protein